MSPAFHDYLLIAPNARVDRPSSSRYDSINVIKADALVTAIEKRVDNMGVAETFASGAKMVSFETLETFARELVKRHRPIKINYAKKFGISDAGNQSSPQPNASIRVKLNNVQTTPAVSKSAEAQQEGKVCPTCGASMVKRVAKKGANARNFFWGCSTFPKCKGIVPCE